MGRLRGGGASCGRRPISIASCFTCCWVRPLNLKWEPRNRAKIPVSTATDSFSLPTYTSTFICTRDDQVSFEPNLFNTHTHTCLMALCPGLPGWAGTRKVKPIWILLKQETVSGSGISWAICKSEPRSRQITTPAPHRSVFYRPDAVLAAQTTIKALKN